MECGWRSLATTWRVIDTRIKVVDLQDILRGEHDENAARKDLLPSEAVAIAKALEPEEKKEAEKRKAHSGPRDRNLPSRSKTRDKVAASTGLSGRTLEKV